MGARKLILGAICILISTHLHAQLQTVGTATADATNTCFTLTQNVGNSAGAVWEQTPIDLNQSFTFNLTMNLGCSDGGADGIVFVLHNTPNVFGSTGGAIGYNTLNPSLVIEFDTWRNIDRNDPTYDHLGLMVDGNGNHNGDLVGPIQISANSTNVEDCNDYPVTIDWDATTQVLSLYYDCVLRFSHPIDITNTIFSGNSSVYWGFIATTGGATNIQTVCFDVPPPPPITLADATICAGDTYQLNGPTGFETYQWTPATGLNNPNIANPIATPTTTTTYTLVATELCGGTSSDSMTLTVLDLPDAIITGTGTICEGGGTDVDLTVNFTGTAPWTFTYTDGSTPVTITTSDNPYTLTVSQAGVYTLVDVESGGCIGTVGGASNVTTTVVSILDNIIDPLCNGESSGSITVNGNGGIAPYTYNWSDPALSGNVLTNLPAGTYDVTVTDTNGCEETSSIALNEPPALSVSVGTPPPIDCINTTSSVNATGSGGTPSYSYSWSNGDTGSTLNTSIAGTYTVTVTDTNGCEDQTDVTIIDNSLPPPDATIAGSGVICPNTGTTVDITVSFVGTGPWTFTYTNGTTPETITTSNNPYTITVDEPGTYVLLDVEESGCVGNVSGSAIITTSIISINVTESDLLCNGDSNGSITVNGTGGVAPYNYIWSDPALSGNVLTNLNAGTYDVTVADANGCEDETSITIDEPPVLVATMGAPITIDCNNANGSATVSVSGGTASYSYNWSNGNTGATIITNIGGTYDVTVTDANGCTDNATVTINENLAAPAAVAVATGFIDCINTSINLSGTGSSTGVDFTYLWTTNDGSIESGATTLNPVVNSGGTYTLTVTNTDNGCENTASVTVIEQTDPPNADAGPGDQLTCLVTEVFLFGTNSDTGPNYTYSWSTTNGNIVSGETTLTPLVNEAGTYTITVTNTTNGCSETDNVIITENITSPVANAGPPQTINCNNPVIQLDGTASSGGSNMFYEWTTVGGNIVSGQNSLTPVVSAEGDYLLTITDISNGCDANSSVSVTAYLDQPTAAIAPPSTIDCNNPVIQLDGSGSSQGSDISYVWTTIGGNIVSGQSTDSPSVDEDGTYILTVFNDLSECMDVASVIVTDLSVLPNIAGVATDLIDCVTPTVTLDGTGSSTGPEFAYSWTTTNGTIVSDGTTLFPVVGSAGAYTLTVLNTATNCEIDLEVQVFDFLIDPTINIPDPGSINCVDTIVEIIATVSGASNFDFEWTTPNGNYVADTLTLSPVVDVEGFYELSVVNNVNGCESSLTIPVVEDYDYPIVDMGLPGEINCINTEYTIDATNSSNGANFNYDWSDSEGNIVSGDGTLQPVVDEGGLYTLIITNTSNQCKDTSSIQITVNQFDPIAIAGPDDLLGCWSPTIVVDGSQSSSGHSIIYNWTSPNGSIVGSTTNSIIEVSSGGDYILTVTDTLNGCKDVDEVFILEDFDTPQIGTGPGGEINCIDLSIPLNGTASGNTQNFIYEWQFFGTGSISTGQGTLNAVAIQPDTYYLYAQDTVNGCAAIDSILVTKDDNVPVIDFFATDTLDCVTSSLTIDASGSSQGNDIIFEWSTTDGQIESGATTLTPVINSPGSYSLVLTDTVNNCETESVLNIEPDTIQPLVSLLTPGLINCINTIVPIEASIGAVGSDYTVNWTSPDGGVFDNGQSDLIINVSTEGTYDFTITNTINGCLTDASIGVIEDLEYPQVTGALPDTINCDNPNVTLEATVDTQGDPYTFNWTTDSLGSLDNNIFTLNPIVSGASVYTLYVQNDINGCAESIDISVGQNVEFPDALAQVNSFLSCDSLELQIDGTSSSSGPNYIYLWTTLNGNILSGSDGLTPVVNEQGTYTLIVENTDNNCKSDVDVVVTQNLIEPSLSIAIPDTLTCGVLEIDVFGDAGIDSLGTYVYSWNTSNGNISSTTSTPTITASLPGSYTFEVLDTYNGCSTSVNTQVIQDIVIPNADAGVAQVLNCVVLDQQLDASGSSSGSIYEYNWSTLNGSIVGPTNIVNPVIDEPGTYTVTVFNSMNECSNTADITVSQDIVDPDAEAGALDTLDCYSTTLDLNGLGSSTGTNFEYSWISVDGYPIINSNSLSPTIDSDGTYELTVTNTINGCTNTDNVTIARDTIAPILAALQSDTLTCGVLAVPVGVQSDVNTSVSYNWNTLNGTIISATDIINPEVSSPGIYSLELTNLINGCSTIEDVPVYQNIIKPVADAGPGGLITCDFQTINISGSAFTNSGQTNIQWYTNNGEILAGSNTENPLVGAEGNYAMVVTDLVNECKDTSNTFIQVNQEFPLIASLIPEVLDCDTEEVVVDATVTAMQPQYEFVWITNNGNFSSDTDVLNPTVNIAGQYILSIEDTINGCVSIDTIDVVDDYEYPTVDAGEDFLLPCFEDFSTLSGTVNASTSNLQYNWTTTDGNIISGSNTTSPAIDQEGIYTFTVLNLSNGCEGVDLVEITENVPNILDLETSDPPCAGSFGTLLFTNVEGGTAPYLYSIDNGNNFTYDLEYSFLVPGEYNVLVQDANGCETETQLAIITDPPVLDIELTSTIQYLEGESAQIFANVSYSMDLLESISWSPAEGLSCVDCLDPFVTIQDPSVYELTVVTNNGCSERAFVNVLVDKSVDLFIPNIFSPNIDSANDIFMIYADTRNIKEIQSFEVFDRWGEKVFTQYNFQPNDPVHGWDGTLNGVELDPAVFVYYAKVEMVDGRIEFYEGDVFLAR